LALPTNRLEWNFLVTNALAYSASGLVFVEVSN
jgi:hypothetical protein